MGSISESEIIGSNSNLGICEEYWHYKQYVPATEIFLFISKSHPNFRAMTV